MLGSGGVWRQAGRGALLACPSSCAPLLCAHTFHCLFANLFVYLFVYRLLSSPVFPLVKHCRTLVQFMSSLCCPKVHRCLSLGARNHEIPARVCSGRWGGLLTNNVSEVNRGRRATPACSPRRVCSRAAGADPEQGCSGGASVYRATTAPTPVSGRGSDGHVASSRPRPRGPCTPNDPRAPTRWSSIGFVTP
jgi:hypothetical protein